jgi:hypothetical protein
LNSLSIIESPTFHEIGKSRADEVEECSHAKGQPGSSVIERMNLLVVPCRTLEHFDQAPSRHIVANVIVGEPCKADACDCHSPQGLSVVRK